VCETTHVLLPAWSVPRRRDSAEVIGQALLAKAQGAGHRTIAARLRRPPGTVRGWLRAFARRAAALSSCARRWMQAIDVAADQPAPSASPFVEAVDTLGSAARACRLCLNKRAGPWELAVALTGGLLHGRPRDPGR
jgi:Homeodomain-like domain